MQIVEAEAIPIRIALKQPFEITGGSIEVPGTSGLGVEISEEKVEKYQIDL